MSTNYPNANMNPSPLETVNSGVFGPAVLRALQTERLGAYLVPHSVPRNVVQDKPYLYLRGKGGSSNYPITAAIATPAEVDSTLLKGEFLATGDRPIKITAAFTAASPAAQALVVYIRWDGVDIPHRIAYLDGGDNEHVVGLAVVEEPTAGSHTIALTAAVTGGTGTIYSDDAATTDNNRVTVIAEEIG